ncbi:DNA-directed DNA polymerase II small subunit [Candidatus Woesearchaeota archaeon]|nr:DNA-directed DNA polymerase II small subunit [Candidatus Woesearchaeota archaeon]
MEQQTINKKEVVSFFLSKGILLSPDMLQLEEEPDSIYTNLAEKTSTKDFLVLSKDINELLASGQNLDTNWSELERAKAIFEKGRGDKIYKQFLGYLGSTTKQEAQQNKEVKVVVSYEADSQKRDIQDFVQYFNARYKAIEKILRNRQELSNTLSINRILHKTDRSHISLVGAVGNKQTTKNNNIMLTIEDPTGAIKVLVNKNKPELYEIAKDIVPDEVIGVAGVNGDKIVFANAVLQPDIPQNDLKKSPHEACVAVLSDLHIGSNNFLAEDFDRFIEWINLRKGSKEQLELAKKVKYILIAGDTIDGCGVYPGQDKELTIKDISKQYEGCARLLKKIPQHINIIICPGNHDAMRIAEPQPPLYKDFAGSIHELPNVTLVSNPALVNIHSNDKFSGFDILLYHGYSFDHFVANVDSIRNRGGYDRADLIMKFLLKKRHLAPTHTSTLYIPTRDKDPLVIDKIPDIFVTGHIHKSIVANYKNVTMVCGSCWQSKTTFQERVGHNPEPSRVPIINLKTREVKILKFGK